MLRHPVLRQLQKENMQQKQRERHVATSYDRHDARCCLFPRCLMAEQHPDLGKACFQVAGGEKGPWPPTLGQPVNDPCSLGSLARLGALVVYAIGAREDGPIKIGITSDVVSRLSALQTGNWQQLSVLSAHFAGARATAAKIEAALHGRLAHRSMVGEWFDLPLSAFHCAMRELVNVNR
ncbi:GIY-YIG nuclease family protein [Bradyrhizobium sp. CCBAU 51753]|uniref:GIY-YIG nuclease family protein n=1 Tax=Bradyrhizobium sp. CCBAU 51753 TaxID=1325100 RepID=UPI00188A491F|nr:GIY-YIG nuclease family protein [Bradyrhizobium sp. CCBAU 51753]QOZ25307.1 hypothetical protein XH93_18200 [Bradyrhizobium sp. CCBAU 51753]